MKTFRIGFGIPRDMKPLEHRKMIADHRIGRGNRIRCGRRGCDKWIVRDETWITFTQDKKGYECSFHIRDDLQRFNSRVVDNGIALVGPDSGSHYKVYLVEDGKSAFDKRINKREAMLIDKVGMQASLVGMRIEHLGPEQKFFDNNEHE